MVLQPMHPVTGGVLDPENVVGRQRERASLLVAIASGGAYVVGDRRMGKTSLLRLVARDLREAGHIVVTISAETDDLTGFNDTLLAAIRKERAFSRQWKSWTKAFEGEVRLGTTGNGIRLQGKLSKPGSAIPETDIMALCARAAHEAGAASVVLIIDEIAQLANFLHETDPSAGGELLRTLRRLRQGESSVRVVLAGSVGLHHAVDDTTALNDLPRIHVASLAREDAVILTRRLMLGVCDREDAHAAEELAHAVADIPYYIQRIVGGLESDADLTSCDWTALVEEAIDQNLWGTDHFVTRLVKYYPDVGLAKAALDAIAATSGTDLDSLLAELNNTRDDEISDSELSDLLNRLALDHYLEYRAGRFTFTSGLLETIWTRTRKRLR